MINTITMISLLCNLFIYFSLYYWTPLTNKSQITPTEHKSQISEQSDFQMKIKFDKPAPTTTWLRFNIRGISICPTGLQIELARRDVGRRVEEPDRVVHVRGVRRKPFVPHDDQESPNGSSGWVARDPGTRELKSSTE